MIANLYAHNLRLFMVISTSPSLLFFCAAAYYTEAGPIKIPSGQRDTSENRLLGHNLLGLMTVMLIITTSNAIC